MKKSDRHLYIMQSDVTGDFKVGISKDIDKRLKQLQTGSPYKIQCIYRGLNEAWREKSIHKDLNRPNPYNLGGRTTWKKGEWFNWDMFGLLPQDIQDQIDLEFVNTWWDKKC